MFLTEKFNFKAEPKKTVKFFFLLKVPVNGRKTRASVFGREFCGSIIETNISILYRQKVVKDKKNLQRVKNNPFEIK